MKGFLLLFCFFYPSFIGYSFNNSDSICHDFTDFCNVCSGEVKDNTKNSCELDGESLYSATKNQFDFFHSVNSKDELLKMRKILLSKRNLKTFEVVDLSLHGKSIEWTKAFEFAKIAVATKPELEFILKYNDEPEITGRLQQAVFIFLAHAIDRTLMTYESSIEQDVAELKSIASEGTNRVNILSYLLLEKHVLQHLSVQLKFAASHVKNYQLPNLS